jgi:hypothetical protein
LSELHQDESEAWPLTPIQSVFFGDNPHGINHYTLSFIVKLERQTTDQKLAAALLQLTTCHIVLRSRFRKNANSGRWEQFVVESGPSSFLFSTHTFVNREEMQIVVKERQAAIDLVHGPVFSVDVFRGVNEPHTLLMNAHHVVMDLVSWRIVWFELNQFLSGTASLLPLRLSFPAWCQLQQEEAKMLGLVDVLPFEVCPPNFEYWGITPGENLYCDVVEHLSTIGPEATALLLGKGNDCLRTETLDILVGALMYSFGQVF